MEYVIQVTGHMHELSNIMEVEIEIIQREKMFDVFYTSRNEVIHANDVIILFYEPIAQVRPQESRRAGNEYPLLVF